MPDYIRITLADDHPIVLEGIANLLRTRNNFIVGAAYTSGETLLEGLAKDVPDVLLLDFYFPDTTGLQLVKKITKLYKSIRILVLTSSDSSLDISDMMKNGCSGYILKSAPLPILIEAIEAVNRGEQYLQAGLKELLLNNLLMPSQRKEVTDIKFTQRERTILTLLSEGKTNNEIAAQLFVSLRTIENNRLALYKKMGVKNTAELIKSAIKQGLLHIN